MAESIVEQIYAALVIELEAITGDGGTTYWYTPDKVVRVEHFQQPPDSYGDVVYMIRDTGDELSLESAEFGESRRMFEVFIQLCRVDDRGNQDPFDAEVAKGTIRNRMVQDVIKKLDGSYTRGGLSFDTEIVAIQREFEIRTDWIVAEMQLEVTYDHDFDSP